MTTGWLLDWISYDEQDADAVVPAFKYEEKFKMKIKWKLCLVLLMFVLSLLIVISDHNAVILAYVPLPFFIIALSDKYQNVLITKKSYVAEIAILIIVSACLYLFLFPQMAMNKQPILILLAGCEIRLLHILFLDYMTKIR